MGQTNKRSAKGRAIIQEVAEITGYSESMVEKVIKNHRQNEYIMEVYMEYLEKKNALKDEVLRVVPFPDDKKQKTKAV